MLSDHILYSHDFSDRECVDIIEKFNADHCRERKGLIKKSEFEKNVGNLTSCQA